MAKSIKIERAHQLDEIESWNLAVDLLEKLVEKYGGEIEEYDESLSYKHPTGLRGEVVPVAGKISVELKLNLMTRAFAADIEQGINSVLDRYV